jgi:subtilisin family serine protease
MHAVSRHTPAAAAVLALLLALALAGLPAARATQFHAYVRTPTAVPANVTAAMGAASVDSFDEGVGALYVFDADSAAQVHAQLAAWYGVAQNQTDAQRRRSVTELGGTQIFVAEVRPVNARYAAQSWGLDRIDQRARPLDGLYIPANGGLGTGVTAWVVDTGLDETHIEFVGPGPSVRAQNVYAAYTPATDCDGHGTHVAGTIGGLSYGVARNVQLRGVKVLNCAGAGTTFTVAQGLLYVLAHLTGADVVNLSLGYGSRDATIEAVLDDLMAARAVVVAAAGNENQDACSHYPSAQVGVISAGATDSVDQRSSFSNWGSCVDLFAPGSLITSARLNGGAIVMSGTSMATPHVAGAAALILEDNPEYTVAQTWVAILARATLGVVGNELGSPDRLLYVREPTSASASPSVTRAPGASPSRTGTRAPAASTSATHTRAPQASASRTPSKPPKPSHSAKPSHSSTRTPTHTRRPRHLRGQSDAAPIAGAASDAGPFALSWSMLCAMAVAVVAALV